ncbi:MAG: hypothetical protein ACYCXP_08470 [Leptospirillum sp.]
MTFVGGEENRRIVPIIIIEGNNSAFLTFITRGFKMGNGLTQQEMEMIRLGYIQRRDLICPRCQQSFITHFEKGH